MQEQSKKRLFIALNLPQNIKNEIFDLINKLAKQNKTASIKWVKPNGIHLTLHFLGYVSADLEEQIKLAMQCFQGKFGQLQFKLSKINAFPNLTCPRVIFLECRQIHSKPRTFCGPDAITLASENSAKLKNSPQKVRGKSVFKLRELLGEKLIQLGIKVDKRPWKPHLTLGRVKEGCNVKIEKCAIVSSEFMVNTFELMESVLRPAGAEYKKVISYIM